MASHDTIRPLSRHDIIIHHHTSMITRARAHILTPSHVSSHYGIIAPYQLMASDHCHIDHTILTSSHNSHIIAFSCDRVHTSSCHHTISFRMVRSYPHIVLASSSDIVTHTVVTSSHGSHDHAITPSRHILTCSRYHIIASHDIMKHSASRRYDTPHTV